MDDFEDRQYRMRRPLMSRIEHEQEVAALKQRIEQLEAELREHRRRQQVRRSGW